MLPSYDPQFLELLFNVVKYPGTITVNQVLYEGLVYVLAAFCIYHGFKTFGRWKTLLFFFGSFFYTGLESSKKYKELVY